MPEPGTIQVLLLEDSADDAAFALRALTDFGLVVQSERVETECEFMEALKRGPDVVIADCALPCFSGEQALKALRRSDPDLPYIVVSGTIGEKIAVSMMRAGANDYLLKDYGIERLGPVVVRELQDAENRRDRRRLEQNWQLADRALANAAEAIFITDAEFRVISVNLAYTEATGFCADEVIGQVLPAIANGIYHEHFLRELHESLESTGR